MKVTLDDGQSFEAYLAKSSSAPAPGLVILQEIFGVSASLKAAAHNWAGKGFVTVIPDLFWRQQPDLRLAENDAADRARGMALAQKLDVPLALQDIRATVSQLRQTQECNGLVGALGFCMGGKLAFLAACDALIDAAVGYYPTAVHTVLDASARLQRPLELHIAEQDALCPPDVQQLIAQRLGDHPHVLLHTHRAVGHAFARIGGDSYDAAAAEEANRSTLHFLQTHLGGK